MEEAKPKLKLAVYWAAACGGCCVSVLDVHEKLFDVIAAADLVFWPIALDIKYDDVEKMPDGHIDVSQQQTNIERITIQLQPVCLDSG